MKRSIWSSVSTGCDGCWLFCFLRANDLIPPDAPFETRHAFHATNKFVDASVLGDPWFYAWGLAMLKGLAAGAPAMEAAWRASNEAAQRALHVALRRLNTWRQRHDQEAAPRQHGARFRSRRGRRESAVAAWQGVGGGGITGSAPATPRLSRTAPTAGASRRR